MSNPNPPATAARHPRTVAWIGFVALGFYAWFLSHHRTVVAGGANSSRCLNSAKLFPSGELFSALRVPPEFLTTGPLQPTHFVPLGFTPTANSTLLAPTYPAGLPLPFALAALILPAAVLPRGGWRRPEIAALARKAGRPVCALLFDSEEKDAFQRCAGEWTQVNRVRSLSLWQLTSPTP